MKLEDIQLAIKHSNKEFFSFGQQSSYHQLETKVYGTKMRFSTEGDILNPEDFQVGQYDEGRLVYAFSLEDVMDAYETAQLLILQKFTDTITTNTRDLEPEFAQAISEDFWEMYEQID